MIRYELYRARHADGPWSLDSVFEDRLEAIAFAEQRSTYEAAAYFRLIKSRLDAGSDAGEVCIGTYGSAPSTRRNGGLARPVSPRPASSRATGAACTGPADLYRRHSIRKIEQHFGFWLSRRGRTAFELLHDPDLAEDLVSSPQDLLFGLEAVAREQSGSDRARMLRRRDELHEIARQALARATSRARVHSGPQIDDTGVAGLAARLTGESEAAYLLASAVMPVLGEQSGSARRLDWLIGQLEDLDTEAPSWPLARSIMVPLLTGEFRATPDCARRLGGSANAGDNLKCLAHVLVFPLMSRLTSTDAGIRDGFGPLPPLALSLASNIDRLGLEDVRTVLLDQLVDQLGAAVPLYPDLNHEIEFLRVLASVLAHASREPHAQQAVQNAFFRRSRQMVETASTGQWLALCQSRAERLDRLLRLLENLIGDSNKLKVLVMIRRELLAPQIRQELLSRQTDPAVQLQWLARVSRSIRGCRLDHGITAELDDLINRLALALDQTRDLVRNVVHADTPVSVKIARLTAMAEGITAPMGAISNRAQHAARTLAHLQAQN